MKRFCCLSISLTFLFVCFWGIQDTTAKTLYDDFSGTYLDTSKWYQGEFVREVSQGKLVMKLHNSPTVEDVRKRAPFVDPSSINTIECDIMVSVATLDSGTDPESYARVDGRFYNAQNSGTERGDIWAGLYIGDRGNGLEVWWKVIEATDDVGDNWDDKGIGSLSVPGLSYNQSYTVKIEYNGANKFTFTVAGVSDSFTGPVRQGPEYTKYKALETVVYTDGGAGNGYVSASFDNVLTNGTAYDDFSTPPLDQTKWGKQESAREIENGKVRLISHSTGDKDTTNLDFSEISPYTEALVTIKSSSMIDPGDRGIARIDGFLYNDTYGPDNYNDYEGNVWVAIYINYHGDGSLNAACYAERTLDAANTQFEELFYRQFNLPIILARAYRLSLRLTDDKLIFTCEDTVTGRMDVFVYEISKPVYEPYEKDLGLRSRVYGNSTGGYMAVEFDDVYTDVAEPAAAFNATGDWEITGSNPWADSGCDLPDVGDTSPITITQNGNDLTIMVHDDEGDITLTGFVYGDTYTFMMTEENNGETEIIYGIFTLSQNTSGTGNISFIWTDGVEKCESGFDITIAKPTTDDGGGGGGGGCFIEALSHEF